jgi:hypothetical protein
MKETPQSNVLSTPKPARMKNASLTNYLYIQQGCQFLMRPDGSTIPNMAHGHISKWVRCGSKIFTWSRLGRIIFPKLYFKILFLVQARWTLFFIFWIIKWIFRTLSMIFGLESKKWCRWSFNLKPHTSKNHGCKL